MGLDNSYYLALGLLGDLSANSHYIENIGFYREEASLGWDYNPNINGRVKLIIARSLSVPVFISAI